MACKFHAAMNHLLTPTLPAAVALALALGAAAPAWADAADRNQPVTISADQQSTVDLLKQVVTFSGNVIISQGTLAIRADRVEVRETPQGFRSAVALGTPGKPASFRQKREGLDEYVEGSADRIEYDGGADTVHFVGHAKVRRLRGASVADELTGNEITYDNVSEVFSVEGGPSNVTPANPTGRVRAVLTPAPKAASAPARPASAPPLLRPSPGLGERR